MALSTTDRARLLELLQLIDHLRLTVAAAAPVADEAEALLVAQGLTPATARSRLGVPRSVSDWGHRQRRILEQGTAYQQMALEVAEELLTEAAETADPGQVQPPYCENISAMP